MKNKCVESESNKLLRYIQITNEGDKSPVGVCKRVEALQVFHVFKTILIVSYRRDEVLIWLIFHLFGTLFDNN